MPLPSIIAARPRRAAYSVTEVATDLCGLSRARFYDLIREGVMPYPVYCLRTRRPMYTADLAALCMRVKETNIAIDGRYVIFHSRRSQQTSGPVRSGTSTSCTAPVSPLLQEMVETLKAMGVRASDSDVLGAISRQCPTGVAEQTFEADLRAVFDALRRQESA